MANNLLNLDNLAKVHLADLQNNLVLANKVFRYYDTEIRQAGDTITIAKPQQFTVRSGTAYSAQDIVTGTTTISLDNQIGVDAEFTSKELTLQIDEPRFDGVRKRVIEPAMIRLAQAIDSSIAGLYTKVYNFAGTPGTPMSTYDDVGEVEMIQNDAAVPMDGRIGVVGSMAKRKLAGLTTTIFNEKIVEQGLRRALMGDLAGYEMNFSQSTPTHTVGALGGTPLVNGGSQAVTYVNTKDVYTQSLITDGWSNSVTGVVKAGDVINIAGVFAINPVTKASTGRLQDFVITADANSDGSGNATLTISPQIIVSGAFQTVSAQPADNAAITIKTGTASTAYKQNLFFHPNAFALVTSNLDIPNVNSAEVGYAKDEQTGLALRIIRQYDIDSDKIKHRIDILYGVAAIYPQLAARRTD